MDKAKSQSVKVGVDSLHLARIASGYTGETLMEYVTRVVADAARRDIEDQHAKYRAAQPDQPAPDDTPARPSRRKPKAP